jgi:hypothetical protein
MGQTTLFRQDKRPVAAPFYGPQNFPARHGVSTLSVARYIEHGRLPSPQHNLALTLPRSLSMLWRAKPSLQVEA